MAASAYRPTRLLFERAGSRCFHPWPAGEHEAVLASKLGPTVRTPDPVEFERICRDCVPEQQARLLLLVGRLLVRDEHTDVSRASRDETVTEDAAGTRIGAAAESAAPARAGAGPPPSPGAGKRHRTWRDWMAAGRIMVFVLATIGVAVPPGATAHLVWAAQSAADPEVAAVQAVIQQAHQEQAQALATGDQSVMSDTATASYYRQSVQVMQSLASDGVTTVTPTQLTWALSASTPAPPRPERPRRGKLRYLTAPPPTPRL
jgi:hypothetical protein